MIRVQFTGDLMMYQANFDAVSEDVVQLTGSNIPKNENGFKVYRQNGMFLGDYSDFNQIESEVKGGYRFTRQS